MMRTAISPRLAMRTFANGWVAEDGMDASLLTAFIGHLTASYKNRRRTWASYDNLFQSRGQGTPSSETRRRRVDSDIPTTVDGSPSTRVMNGPPRLSTVNAPATCSGSPVATYAAISSSVTSAANVTDASATACASAAAPRCMRY